LDWDLISQTNRKQTIVAESSHSNNYPDVLGYITGATRFNIGVAQVALALRPQVVRAGRPFEAIMLIQNASDADLDVVVTLHLPDRDAAKKKDRFVAKVNRLVISIQGGEVGYVVLPMSCLPDTAVSSDYKIGMEIAVKTLSKAQRIRSADGGGTFDPQTLKDERVTKLEDLKKLRFSVSKRSGLLSNTLEIGFSVMSGKVGAIADLQPGWTSLWTMQDYYDDRKLLERYYQTMKVKILPALTRETVFQPFKDTVEKYFQTAKYPLKPLESTLITKLLTLMVEYSLPAQASYDPAAGIYNFLPLLSVERLMNPEPMLLPKWASAFLRALSRDEKLARQAVAGVTRFTFPELLTDAMTHAFQLIEVATGEDMGSESEVQAYTDRVLGMFRGQDEQEKMDFTHAYMPLVLGGIIAYDRVLLPDEDLGATLQDLRVILNERNNEISADSIPVARMALKLVDQVLMKYGYRSK
jgi:hypothetical protein